jgi:hypothetical protein
MIPEERWATLASSQRNIRDGMSSVSLRLRTDFSMPPLPLEPHQFHLRSHRLGGQVCQKETPEQEGEPAPAMVVGVEGLTHPSLLPVFRLMLPRGLARQSQE